MARLIPKVNPSDISNNGERLVAEALVDQLPDDCIVYHSFPWLRPERNDYSKKLTLRQGEADFIVVHPKAGFLILEVKGGDIEYDNTSRSWTRINKNRNDPITDPFEQANRNLHTLVERIKGSDKHFPCPYGYAVVFPHCDYSGGEPPGSDSKIIFSSRDMDRLGTRCKNALDMWNPTTRPVNLSKEDMDKIQLGLSPSMKLTPLLFRKLDEQNERLHRLTDGQLQLLEGLHEHSRAAIKGVAGSGKTILANVKAQAFAREGKKTLFVCYNRLLADALAAEVPDSLANLITYTSFHSLCAQWCRNAKVAFKPPSGDAGDFWSTEAPDKLMDAIDTLSDRFDAVVVDEGQDFLPEWWMALELINKDEEQGPFYAFYDPDQNLFDVKSNIPKVEVYFTLPVNCRNTHKIAEFCGKISGTDFRVRDDAPEGDDVNVQVIPNAEKRQDFILNTVDAWVRQGKLKPSRVVIQSLYDKSKTCLSDVNAVGKTPIVDDQERWRNDEGVLFATVRAFKGLEVDAVIFVDVPDVRNNEFFSESDLYVGCSRAKHLLVVAAKEMLFK